MSQGPTNDFGSPLEGVVEGLPAEQPPAGLKERCLSALRTEEAKQRRAAPAMWAIGLRAAAAVAAVFVLVVAVMTVVPHKSPGKESLVAQRPAPSHAATAPAPGARVAPDASRQFRVQAEPAKPEASAGPSRGGGFDLRADIEEASPMPSRGAGERHAEMEERMMPASPPPAGGMVGQQRVEMRNRVVAKRAPQAHDAITPLPSMGDAVGMPAKPWRDDSGDRQKITRKEMEVEVPDVQRAYDRATSIIEKARGYVETEDVRMDRRSRERAHLVARIPVDRLDGAVAQLRELGRVVLLIGESDDRTKEYYTQGSEIRDLGAKEVELVDKYERERDPYTKRQLYNQIMAVREQNRGKKLPLMALSEETHLATLDLTLLAEAGPLPFLRGMARNAGTAAAWFGASAIFWLPVLIIVLVAWRRRVALPPG